MKELTLECHDCGEETTILDRYKDTNKDSIEHCPHCGSKNIDVV